MRIKIRAVCVYHIINPDIIRRSPFSTIIHWCFLIHIDLASEPPPPLLNFVCMLCANPLDSIDNMHWMDEKPRRVQKLYPSGFAVGIVMLPNVLGLMGGGRMPGRLGIYGDIDVAR